MLGEEGLDGTLATTAQQNFCAQVSPHSETTLAGGENGSSSGSGFMTPDQEKGPCRARRAHAKRQRGQLGKEDDLLPQYVVVSPRRRRRY